MSSPMSINTPDTDDVGNRAFLEEVTGLTNDTIQHDDENNSTSNNEAPLLPHPSLDITMPTLSIMAVGVNVIPCGSKQEMQYYLNETLQNFIQDFFNDDNPQYPYTKTIQWSMDQNPTCEYHLTITIRQPTIIGKEIDRFHDVYHAYDDDQDENDDENIDFDDLFTDFYQNENKNEIPIEPIVQDNNQNVIIHLPVAEEQQQLSATKKNSQLEEKQVNEIQEIANVRSKQQLLSTQRFQTSSIIGTVKKLKVTLEDVPDQDMPRYLSNVKHIFDEKMNNVLQLETTTTTVSNSVINIEQLRQIALLIHKIGLNNLNISLWITYLCSGTGQMKNIQEHLEKQDFTEEELPTGAATTSQASRLLLWPQEVKTSLIKNKYTTLELSDIGHQTCLQYVHHRIRQFRDSNTYYDEQLQERKKQLNNGLIQNIENAIRQFVEEYGISIHHISIEGQIAAVTYNYNDRLLELEFHRDYPSPYQIEVFNKLTQDKMNKETSRIEVAILKQRMVHQHLPSTFESLQIPTPIALDAIQNEHIRECLTQQCTRLFERTKSEMMFIYIQAAEAIYEEHRKKFDTNMQNYEADQRSGVTSRKLTNSMASILNQRFKHINEHITHLYNLKLRFFRQSSDGQELNSSHRDDIKKLNVGCSPSLYLYTNHHLTTEQVSYLNRGPTYVSPCQVHLTIHQTNSIDHILLKQLAPLRRQLTKLFDKYPIDLSRRMNFEKEIEQSFKKCFSIPIPSTVQQYSIYEQQLIHSIQLQIKKDHLLLRRTADNQNTYYLGDENEFNQIVNHYMNTTDYFESKRIIDDNHSKETYLKETIKSIDLNLQELHKKKSINENHLAKIPIQPLASFLYHLLRPLFENYSQSTALRNGGDFIQKLEQYCIQSDSLLSHTKFVTFEIHNLHKTVSHDNILKALHQFLTTQNVNVLRHNGLSNDTIYELTELFLKNLHFSYQGSTIYRYIKGCPVNYRLSRLLLNIYLHYYQQPLVSEIRLADEFYGRYYNMGIMTWFGSRTALQTCFTKLNYEHPDVRITYSTGLNVHFLNVYIENQNGKLYTHIYHDPKKQPFLLPYVTGHPRLIHRQWFRYSLIRAGQSCIRLKDFQNERLYIELTFLANGYSLEFVEHNLEQFYKQFYSSSKQTENLDQYAYNGIRRQLFRCLDTQKRRFSEREQLIQNQKLVEFYYLFDWGLRYKFNDQFRKLWFIIIEKDPKFKTYDLKVKLTSRHCYLSNSLLRDY
ncbi:unnamed protein product [Adineta ricciae]|uniref:Helix-turn-helix domain-containing protein n=1 Tax=Adineta ricciae TaxID=249248 RepID=A0A815T3V2_ADIRI|nr:unnamed protein product [Adineta ricciae]CAF1498540.1 unnamed protein product [Adineta ricciae]